MEISRKWRSSCLFLLGLALLATSLQSVQGEDETEAPSQCKPYIEKALKEQQRDEVAIATELPVADSNGEEAIATDNDSVQDGEDDSETGETGETAESVETDQEESVDAPEETEEDDVQSDQTENSLETKEEDVDNTHEESVEVQADASVEGGDVESVESLEEVAENAQDTESIENSKGADSAEDNTESLEAEEDNAERDVSVEKTGIAESSEASENSKTAEAEDTAESQETEHGKESVESVEEKSASTETQEVLATESIEEQNDAASAEVDSPNEGLSMESSQGAQSTEEIEKELTDGDENAGDKLKSEEHTDEELLDTNKEGEDESIAKEDSKIELVPEIMESEKVSKGEEAENQSGRSEQSEGSKEAVPEEDLIQEIEIPENLRPREHIDQLLKLDESNTKAEAALSKISDLTLKELKKLYEIAIKPLETLYKYRDLSNRHFGDSEIFSKPLVVFMGPWSGGKSTLINYLLDNEYNATALRTGAEPSPAYFNLMMHGEEPEVLDGTQLAADFTFAGLQKFGQGLEERLRGLKLPNKLLEKINIVEIPGILEVRKQVSRVFPFNDACQWFIDRADIIFLVYDPSKLDVGPETEAILDQLKGREHQTRIVLNKADQVLPEELMRVQSALIWNISPLMSSAQPPVMYTTSLWSRPYETWAPVRLLHAQERAFLRDLRSAVDKRIENKISSARRFAVRVRNHAKMVDCYLTTYYNHKSVFGNRKLVSDRIIDHPQDYHIYEGLSTLTNISRYDLPDPDVYRDFFRLNPLYDFQQLSATCTYFRGCPINRLDVAIAYDFPELVGKHKKLVESALAEIKAEIS